ncbi:hypothetical protein SAMN04487905_12325 [Actinopolyspora xinjiangensis]|uniref:Uncharacterized protein n=1 Tax=Actinopolyspora xinjiangensis TaxID=405564 RepID=A0A1H0X2C1_9ACTN|nr:hypothetical protein [Actinopolyspora xinjiangensis]SDP97104.1 hypothetical protein SAMN04487905_12325 [Actinopolyspora xinjiangensis]
MPETWPALVLAVVLAATAVVLTVWGHYSERRPRHSGAGPGALTVAQLQKQAGKDMTESTALTGELPRTERGRWTHWRGTLPLSAAVQRRPGRSKLPGRPAQATAPDERPSTALLDRVLAGLHAL